MKKYSLLLLMFLMLIVLSGCKDNTTKNPSVENKNLSSTITSGGSVTVGIPQDLDSLDPHKAVYAGTREVLFNVYEGLVKPTSEGALEPAVAESFQISDDAKTYTFKLRQNLTFHDGSKVTAEDVKYSIERYAGIQGKESAFSNVEKVVVVDETTVQVVLKVGDSEFLPWLTLAIIPKANAKPGETPIGTGPFQVEKFTPGQSLVVKGFAGYRILGRPYLDQVTFKIVTDTEAAFTQMQSGNLDILQYLTSDQVATLSGKASIIEGSVNYVQALFLNNKSKPFQDKRVRQAFALAIDREAINQFIFGGKSHVIGTNMIPKFKKYYNPSTESINVVNVEKAKELIAQAGYGSGFEFTIVVPNNYKPHQTTAEIIVEDLKKIGVTAKIKLVEFTSWISDVYTKRNYEATVVAVDGTLAPSSWFSKNESTAADNFTNYSNSEFDTIYKQAKASISEQEKVTLYNKLQTILAEDAASVYIQDPANLIGVNSKLAGYACYPVAAQDLTNVGFVK